MYLFKTDNLWGTNYAITRGQETHGSVHYNYWKGSASIKIKGDEVSVSSKKWYSSSKVITQHDEKVGHADFKMFSFKPRIIVEYKGHQFILKTRDIWQKQYDVYFGDESTPIGKIHKKGWFGYTYESQMPESVELWFQAVMVSLLITLAAYNSAAAGGG